MTNVMTQTVQASRKVSKSYQSSGAEFGFSYQVQEGENAGVKARRAFMLAKAVVDNQCGQKTGKTRRQLDDLSNEFFNCDWRSISEGVCNGDEVV